MFQVVYTHVKRIITKFTSIIIVNLVVSWILTISRSLLGHEPKSKNLQNKQGTDGGVPTSSPMLKLVREIESVKNVSLAGIYFHTHFC